MPGIDQSTHESLLRAVCMRPFDTDAWSRFVYLYGPLIVAWCRRYGLQDADSRDVAQDVVLQFLKQAERFQYDPSKKFRSYLRQITHAAWCDWVERKRLSDSGSRSNLEEMDQLPARDGLLALMEAEYDHELLGLAMEFVKRRVEPQTWEAFRLLAIEGLSGKEAAERVGMQVGSAFAARHKVQNLLKQEVSRLDV